MAKSTEDLTIRPLEPGDHARVAQIIDSFDDEGYTEEIFTKNFERWVETDPRKAMVAEQGGTIVAYGLARRRQGEPAGKWTALIYVDKTLARQGIGSRLLEEAIAFAKDNGGTHVVGFANEKEPAASAFAQAHGAYLLQHLFESQVDLTAFDPAPYQQLKAGLEGEGYRFTSLAEIGDTDENRRRVHRLDTDCDRDTPGFENWGERTYEDYSRDEHQSLNFIPEGVIIATQGDEWVGMNAVRPTPVEGVWHTDFTGVMPAHRGKKLAFALKALGMELAQTRGAHAMKTNNDTRNAPMLAVNRKLGFQSKPGLFIYRKNLVEAT